MNPTSLVSVVVIFLNAEQFMREAIESVFAQTSTGWELLLVDDGSTDSSTEIALSYAQQHPERVKYLAHLGHCNQGMSASRNLGIHHAKGHYIAFLDADDVWLPHKLERQLKIMDEQPEAAMVFGPAKFWYSWTGHDEDAKRDWVETVSLRTNALVRPPELLRLSALERKIHTATPSSFLVRREVFDRRGGFESPFKGLYEDQVFLTKIYAQEAVYVMADYSELYRKHPESFSTGVSQSAEDAARWVFLNWVKAYLQQHDVEDASIWTALNEAMWPYQHPWRHRFQETIVPIGRKLLPVAWREWLWAKWSQTKQKAT